MWNYSLYSPLFKPKFFFLNMDKFWIMKHFRIGLHLEPLGTNISDKKTVILWPGVQEPQQYAVTDKSLEPKTGGDILPAVLTCVYILLGTIST